MRYLGVILGVSIGTLGTAPVLAQDFQRMTGGDITAALADQSLMYPTATQTFYASGRTLYDAGRPSWGYWTVRGDQYCSQWPPNDMWDCYDMATNGTTIRFIGASGNATDGRFKE